jgi:hypothetical protein
MYSNAIVCGLGRVVVAKIIASNWRSTHGGHMPTILGEEVASSDVLFNLLCGVPAWILGGATHSLFPKWYSPRGDTGGQWWSSSSGGREENLIPNSLQRADLIIKLYVCI